MKQREEFSVVTKIEKRGVEFNTIISSHRMERRIEVGNDVFDILDSN
jgi:hypothetical protein